MRKKSYPSHRSYHAAVGIVVLLLFSIQFPKELRKEHTFDGVHEKFNPLSSETLLSSQIEAGDTFTQSISNEPREDQEEKLNTTGLGYNSPEINLVNSSAQYENEVGLEKSEADFVRLPFEKLELNTFLSSINATIDYKQNLTTFLTLITKDYLEWHKLEQQKIKRNPAYANNVSLLILQGNPRNQGFGDRIRLVLFCYLKAVATKRLLLIDFNKPFPLDDVLVSPEGYDFSFNSNLFKWNESEEFIIEGEGDLSHVHSYVVPERVILQQSYPRQLIISRFLRIAAFNADLELSRKFREAGLDDFKPIDEHVAPFILKSIFQPSQKLRTTLSNDLVFKNDAYLSLHARLGVGVGERGGRFNSSQRNLTLEACGVCLGRLIGEKGKQANISNYFIASDTHEAKKYIHEGILRLIPNATVRESDVEAKHVTRLKSSNEEDLLHFHNTFVDISLLSLGKSMLFVKSGFADMAVWFGAMTDPSRLSMASCEALEFDNISEAELLRRGLNNLEE